MAIGCVECTAEAPRRPKTTLAVVEARLRSLEGVSQGPANAMATAKNQNEKDKNKRPTFAAAADFYC